MTKKVKSLTTPHFLRSLYDQIPTFTCKDGCTTCCGAVPFSRAEKKLLVAGGKWPVHKPLATDRFLCPFASSEKGCEIYELRPLLCRLFGAVSDPILKCPHGCGPAKPLDSETARKIFRKWLGGET